MPGFVRTVEQAYELSATQRIAVLCCALKEYKLQRGRFSEKLDALADTGLSPGWLQLPERYHYRLEGQRFVIHGSLDSDFLLDDILDTAKTGEGDLHHLSSGHKGFYVIGE